MTKKLIIIFATIIIGGVLLITPNSSIFAQEEPVSSSNALNIPSNAALSLSVHPPVAYVAVKPSEKLKHTLVVKNHGIHPLEISVNITDFKADGKTGKPVLQPGKVFNRTTNPSLDFGEPFVLQPGRNHSINLQIDVAEIVPEKEYPLAIMINARSAAVENNEISSSDSSYSQVAGTVVSNLIVYIGENEDNQGLLEIAQLNLPKVVDSFAGIKFDILARNTGKNATLVQGEANIKNIFEHSIAEYIFYPDFVLANSTRMVRGVIKDPKLFDSEGLLDPEKVDTLITQYHYKSPFMLGLYRLHIQLGEDQLEKTVIALPLSLLVLAGIGWLMHLGWKQTVRRLK